MSDTEPGYITDRQALLNRLRRIEGQVRGLQRMVDEETYCIDISTQVSAATRALENVALSRRDGVLLGVRRLQRPAATPLQGGLHRQEATS